MLKLAQSAWAAVIGDRLPGWPHFAAGLVGTISATAALGWFMRDTALDQVAPGGPPMSFETALALMLLVGGWALVEKRPRASMALVASTILLAGDALLGIALQQQSLIGLVVRALSTSGDANMDRRMGLSTAWGLVLLAVALTAVSRARSSNHLDLLGTAAASATLGIAALELLTHLSAWESRWSDPTKMAASTALCLAVLASVLLRRPRAPVNSQRVVTRSMAVAVPLLLAGAVAAYGLVQTRAERHVIASLNATSVRAAAGLAIELEALAMASRTALRQYSQTESESLDLLTEAFPYVVRARRLRQRDYEAGVSFGRTAGATRVVMRVSEGTQRVLALELVPQLLAERLPGAPRGARTRIGIGNRWVPNDRIAPVSRSGAPTLVPLRGAALQLQFWYPDATQAGAAVPAITVPALSAVAVLLAWLIAQSAILRSQSRELALFETTSEAILVADEHGHIESLNGPALTLLQATEASLTGRPLKLLLPDLVFTAAPAGLAGTAPAGRQLLAALQEDGNRLPVEAKVSEVRLRDGLFWVVALRDLSERRQLEREIHARNTVFDIALRASPVGFVMTDPEGRITQYNAAFSQWLKAGDVGLIGTPIASWVSPEHRPAVMLACNRLRTRTHTSFTLPVLGWRRGAPARWAKVSAAAVFLDDQTPLDAISFTFVDTDAEQRLTRQLAETNQFLTTKNQELDQFAYIASHDLKEPLRTLRVYSDYLVKDLADDRRERVVQDADFIRKAAARMSGLIDDLLQLSRAGNAPLRCDNVSLNTCLDAALTALQASLQAADAQLQRPEHLPSVMGDEQQLTRVFINLIGNSIKFRAADRPLRIELTSEPIERWWQISVLDNGIGIPADKTREVMAPFKRLHSQNEVEGSGIGLAIVSKIIERHGGSVALEPRAEGTAAIIRLPDNNPEATDEQQDG